ncbi:MAG: ParB/RepB/Spo0J family partition protein [Thermodesulfobacteriota bacterium]|nr:ParB/RepB/Spo0J family partition protein [Thermodesulfobacteriota bacterium]
MTERNVLGKGLSALIPDIDRYADGNDEYIYCNIEDIQPGKFQPRKIFDEDKILELANSIREKGIIQPLLVREQGDSFELIAGERRLLAAKRAGMTQVPAIIKQVSDTEALELSLIENIQRENLSSLEEAEAYDRLLDEFHLTQEDIGKRVGKDRSTITNYLRLLKLPSDIKKGLSENSITMGHARALLSLEQRAKQTHAYKQVIKKGLSVRQTETLVRQLKHPKKKEPVKEEDNIHLKSIRDQLVQQFGTQVRIVKRKTGRGKIEIDFYSLDDLDRIIETLRGEKIVKENNSLLID